MDSPARLLGAAIAGAAVAVVCLAAMAGGSIAGSAVGGALVGLVPSRVLLPALALILLISAVGLWRHRPGERRAGTSTRGTGP